MMLKLAVLVLLAAVLVPAVHGELVVGFYDDTCPNAEALVKQAVSDEYSSNPGVAPGLIRMHFHDCFVRGCDASVLLDVSGDGSNDTEKTAIPNLTLRGLPTIDAAKTAVEKECPGVVSCADILAFAARDSADLSGGITWDVPAGRRDGRVSIKSEASDNLPPPFFNSTQLVERFANKGLTAEEMVILSGAHSLGIAHCPAFTRRLYEDDTIEDSAPQTDPTLSLAYADLLRKLCPSGSQDPTSSTFMDLITPNTLDNKYYVGVLNNLGLFTSDHALVTQDDLLAVVKKSAWKAAKWGRKFGRAMVKMGDIEDASGEATEIRTDCKLPNSNTAGISNIYVKTVTDLRRTHQGYLRGSRPML